MIEILQGQIMLRVALESFGEINFDAYSSRTRLVDTAACEFRPFQIRKFQHIASTQEQITETHALCEGVNTGFMDQAGNLYLRWIDKVSSSEEPDDIAGVQGQVLRCITSQHGPKVKGHDGATQIGRDITDDLSIVKVRLR